MLRVEHISFGYAQTRVLEDLSFEIKPGGSAAFLGPSGCGKSTLLALLVGSHEPERGRILVQGVTPKLARIKGEMGLILQDFGLLPWKSVRDNLTLGLKIQGKGLDEKKLLDLCRELGIEGLLGRRPAQLSGGQKQRVALGRALLLNPQLILLDEAFSAVDGLTRESLQDLVKSVWQRHEQTLLMVTHDLAEACLMGERIFLCSGPPFRIDRVFENPHCKDQNFRGSAAYQAVMKALRESLKPQGEGH